MVAAMLDIKPAKMSRGGASTILIPWDNVMLSARVGCLHICTLWPCAFQVIYATVLTSVEGFGPMHIPFRMHNEIKSEGSCKAQQHFSRSAIV